MNQLTTQAIILRRTDYGEADRILSLLTPDSGKISLIAKGVRRVKSKLAGGIELFSVSDIGYIKGRSNLGTLVSSRLVRHYDHIVSDITRTMLGYELIKQLNKITEDEPEADYFALLEQAFAALDDLAVGHELIQCWFLMQLLRIGGHAPNLHTDTAGRKLSADQRYTFDYESMSFEQRGDAPFTVDDLKFLRLGFAGCRPEILQKISGLEALLKRNGPLVQAVAQNQLQLL